MGNFPQEFNTEHNAANANDSIISESDSYFSVFMNITKSNLFIGAGVRGRQFIQLVRNSKL